MDDRAAPEVSRHMAMNGHDRHGNTQFTTAVTYDMAAVIDDQEPDEPEGRDMALALRRIIQWVIDGNRCTRTGLRGMTRRMICMIYVIAPELLIDERGRSASLRKIAPRADCSTEWLSGITDAFCKDFGMWARGKKTAEDRAQFKAAAKEAWANRQNGIKPVDSKPTWKQNKSAQRKAKRLLKSL